MNKINFFNRILEGISMEFSNWKIKKGFFGKIILQESNFYSIVLQIRGDIVYINSNLSYGILTSFFEKDLKSKINFQEQKVISYLKKNKIDYSILVKNAGY